MKLVKCINNKNRENILSIDKVYSVLYENEKQYEVICDDKLATLLHKNRFEEVQIEQPTEPIQLNELIKPKYYNKENGISPFEYIKANNLNFFEGNVVKYITRYKEKNGLEDLIKAKTYLDELIKQNK